MSIFSCLFISSFQFNAVKGIGGESGSSDGLKVLEKIVHSLISPHYLPSVSWTGRGKGNEKKVALSKFINVLYLITQSVNKADSSYNYDKSIQKLKYTILKHAPAKFGKTSRDKKELNSDKSCTESADTHSEW